MSESVKRVKKAVRGAYVKGKYTKKGIRAKKAKRYWNNDKKTIYFYDYSIMLIIIYK